MLEVQFIGIRDERVDDSFHYLLMASDIKTIRACVSIALMLLFNFFAALHAFFWRQIFEKF
jgi:hypothetical protein